ncbi:MAG: HAD hydrolase-like protein [Candidatus Cloacimonadota bacterium]|nr:HAD hydrolase-like protein [Candidatus Cloacimonadota bacterium]
MKYKLIIFDFDGTLADTFTWFANAVDKVSDKYNFKKVDKSNHEIFRNFDAKKLIKFLNVPLWKIPFISKYMRKMMSKDVKNLSLFQGVDLLLKKLSDNAVTIAVVSTNSENNVRKILGPQNTALIDNLRCGVSIFGKKKKLKKIIKKSGISPNQIIYIGDEIRDLQAAKSVGLAFGAVSWGYNTIESIKAYSPQEVFESVDDIFDKLLAG